MKVWGLADPRSLRPSHLLGEHADVHALIATVSEVYDLRREGHEPTVQEWIGWSNHPEAARFYDHARPNDGVHAALNGLEWLYVRHEFLRVEMQRRWERHSPDQHRTPIPDLYAISFDAGSIVSMYEQGGVEDPDHFTEWVAEVGFPPTPLDYDTPWDRDFDGDRGEYVASWEG